jgi:hypothetical protein
MKDFIILMVMIIIGACLGAELVIWRLGQQRCVEIFSPGIVEHREINN